VLKITHQRLLTQSSHRNDFNTSDRALKQLLAYSANDMLMKKIIALCVILVVLVPWQAHGDEKEQLGMAVVLVEKSRLPERFVDLAEAFMETYFERYDKPLAENPADGNPFRKIFIEEVSLGEEELKLMLAEIYAAHFSENELKEIVNFFNTGMGAVVDTESFK
jgi:hypothetical protein